MTDKKPLKIVLCAPRGFCTHIRAALACYEDMPPECQTLARFYVVRKAESVRRLLDAANCPGGELAGELLQKMQRLDDFIGN